jgi:1-acyl-sn-glycerol-3-phosphate acyltransferase
MSPQSPPPVRAYRTAAVLLTTAAVRLSAYRLTARVRGRSPQRALQIMQHWNRNAWDRLGLDVDVHGTRPEQHCLFVANHRSYLDIAVLNGALGVVFLSRADVASWPIFGGVAREVGTVFVDRDDPAGRIRAARALARRLRDASVAVFPEGTTGGDRLPGAFQPGLFRLLRRLRVTVVPVTVRYSDRRVYWVENLSLWEHLSGRVLVGAPLRCSVHIGPPIAAGEYADDDGLSRAAYAAVCAPIEEFGELCSAGAHI